VIDEFLKLSPTISDPQEVVAGNRNRPSDADLRPLEPFPQAPQSRDSPAPDPGPVNPEDNRRLSVYPEVEVERTADVCPSGPARDAGDQGRDGRVIWAGSRSEPARQGRERGRSFDSGHSNGLPAHPRKGPPASMVQILPRRCIDRRHGEGSPGAPAASPGQAPRHGLQQLHLSAAAGRSQVLDLAPANSRIPS
jgi:hypothetical protein